MYVGLYDVYNKSYKNKAEVCGTITANCGCSTGCGCFMKIEKFIVDDIYKDRDARIYNQVAPTLRAEREGLKVVEVMEKENGFFNQAIETAIKENAKPGDCVDAFNMKVSRDGISPTITTRPEGKKTAILPVTNEWRVRKLTPKECWRLMGFTDEDYGNASSVVSKSQLYKQAGNSIVIPVLEALFRQLNIKGVEKWNKN